MAENFEVVQAAMSMFTFVFEAVVAHSLRNLEHAYVFPGCPVLAMPFVTGIFRAGPVCDGNHADRAGLLVTNILRTGPVCDDRLVTTIIGIGPVCDDSPPDSTGL